MSATSAPGRGGCRRSCGWPESRTQDGANAFLRERYMAVFNEKFRVEAREKGTAFRRTLALGPGLDLHGADRTGGETRTTRWPSEIRAGSWRRASFRSSLAGCTVTIHEHLDGRVSIRYGPHVVGRYTAAGETAHGGANESPKSRGKDGPVEAVENHKPVSHRSHRPLEIPQPRRDSHFPTAPAAASPSQTNTRKRSRKPPSASRRGPADLTIKRGIKRANRTDRV